MQERSNSNRLADIAHFIIARSPSDELGATKLNKVLWWVDCAAQRRWGRSITGLTHYVRKDFGPVPEGISQTLRELKISGKVTEELVHTPVHPRRELVSHAEPDIDSLSKDEIDLIHQILDQVRRLSARQASELSHDPYWSELSSGSEMSIAAGALWPMPVSQDALEWGESELARLGLS